LEVALEETTFLATVAGLMASPAALVSSIHYHVLPKALSVTPTVPSLLS
jgi:hypothetical protein